MKKSVCAFFLILIVSFSLFSAVFTERVDLSTLESSIQKDNRILLAKSEDNLLLVYQSNNSKITVSRSSDGKKWSTKELTQIPKGSLQAIATKENTVIIGYEDNGSIYSLTSKDGGANFSLNPTEITPKRQNASFGGIAIDDEDVIHVLYHRHDGHWDYNYARSVNGGQSYSHKLKLTRANDSSSTGYSGNLIYKHGNLYTAYVDNNDKFAIKIGISKDGGEYWTFHRIDSSLAGRISMDVDPYDPNLLYISAINKAGLKIYKVEEATRAVVRSSVVFEDPYLHQKINNTTYSTKLTLGDDRSVNVAFYDFNLNSHELLHSKDFGNSWIKETLSDKIPYSSYEWKADLQAFDGGLYFAYNNAKGNTVVINSPILDNLLIADADGLIELSDATRPFSVLLNTELIWILFSVPKSGNYSIKHLSHEKEPLYFVLHNLDSSDDETFLGDNFVDLQLLDFVTEKLNQNDTYLLIVSYLNDKSLNAKASFSISIED